MRIVDIDTHMITEHRREYRRPLGDRQSDASRQRPGSYDRMIVGQGKAGIAKAALVQASICCGRDNSQVADAVAAVRNALPVYYLPTSLPPTALRSCRSAIGTLDPRKDRAAAASEIGGLTMNPSFRLRQGQTIRRPTNGQACSRGRARRRKSRPVGDRRDG